MKEMMESIRHIIISPIINMHGNYFLMQNHFDLIFYVEAINLLIHQVSGNKKMSDKIHLEYHFNEFLILYYLKMKI